MNKNILKILISVFCIFLAGILFQSNLILAIILFILGLILQIHDYIKNVDNLNKKIDGVGISKISVDDKEPVSPQKGDLWIDTK